MRLSSNDNEESNEVIIKIDLERHKTVPLSQAQAHRVLGDTHAGFSYEVRAQAETWAL